MLTKCNFNINSDTIQSKNTVNRTNPEITPPNIGSLSSSRKNFVHPLYLNSGAGMQSCCAKTGYTIPVILDSRINVEKYLANPPRTRGNSKTPVL